MKVVRYLQYISSTLTIYNAALFKAVVANNRAQVEQILSSGQYDLQWSSPLNIEVVWLIIFINIL